MTLKEKIQALEARVTVLERMLSTPVPQYPQPLYPWHEIKENETRSPMPATWFCARNSHNDGVDSE